MNDQELENLFKDLESDRVECKASISDRGKLREAICAFAKVPMRLCELFGLAIAP